jgi:hypothetical protein
MSFGVRWKNTCRSPQSPGGSEALSRRAAKRRRQARAVPHATLDTHPTPPSAPPRPSDGPVARSRGGGFKCREHLRSAHGRLERPPPGLLASGPSPRRPTSPRLLATMCRQPLKLPSCCDFPCVTSNFQPPFLARGDSPGYTFPTRRNPPKRQPLWRASMRS